MEFEERLAKAIQRGQNLRDKKHLENAARQMSEDELKTLHSGYRLRLSEHIEHCLGQIPNQFPGFRYETIYGERGWGAACFRDDIGAGEDGKRTNFYSRIELTIRPFSSYHVLDLVGKGTIRDKEYFNRNHYEDLANADADQFVELIDVWLLEYAELFAAKS